MHIYETLRGVVPRLLEWLQHSDEVFGLYKIFFYLEAAVHESILFCANAPFVWAPYPPPCIAHTLARYIVFSRPPFIAIYTIHYW